MTIGDRIKARRLQLGMTQEELAHKLGYKSKSSINKIEIGVQELPQKKIVAFANALDTTPQELMGWTELPESSGGFMMPLSILTETDSLLGKDILDREYKEELSRRINEKQNSPIVPPDGQPPVYYTNEETTKVAQKVFDDPNYRILFDAASDAKPEDILMAAEMLRRFKEARGE